VTGAALPASAAALLILLCATWGLGQIAVKVGVEGISPLVQAGLRSVVAVPLLLAWCWLRGITVFVRDGSLPAGLLSGALFAGEFWALYEALALTTASRSTVLLYTAPFWAVLGAHLFVPGDRLTTRKLAGLGLAFAGLVVAFVDRLSGPLDATLTGDVLALLAGALWGATIVVMKATRLTRIAAERTLLYQIGAAALLLPLGLALGEAGVFAPTPRVWAALALQAVIVAFASYAAWFWLVARHKASALAPFLFLTPVFAVTAGALMLGEPVTPSLLAALALIGAGIWAVNRA
jgi:drug/metabolite transporter (DMT)-like permease